MDMEATANPMNEEADINDDELVDHETAATSGEVTVRHEGE